MKFIEKLKNLFAKIFPILQELLAEKFIPSAVKKGYEVFDTFADEKVEALAAQVDKYETTLDPAKRENYRKGIELGAKTLKMVAEKLNIAADAFLEVVNN